MVGSPEETTYRYAHKCLRAFLEGRQTINWAVGTIESSGVRDQRLAEIFERLEGYGDPERYQEALSVCRELGWIE